MPGDERFIERPDGTRIRTRSLGDGADTVVLAHGYGFTMDEWNIIAPMLAERDFRVIAFDQRGHGHSTPGSDGIGSIQMAGDYDAVIRGYDVEDAILVGHSMGGFLSMLYMLEHGTDRLRAALLMATFAGDVSRDNAQNKLQIPLLETGILMALVGIPPIGTLFVRSLTGRPFDPAMTRPVLDVMRAQDHRALVPILKALSDESHYARLGAIDIPCSIIVGTLDHTTPPFHTDEMHARIPNSTLERLPNKGHLLNWEAPEAIVEHIVELRG